MIHHQSRKAIILQSRGEGAPDRSCGEKRMAPPRRIVETASRRPQHSCSLQLLLPLIVRCWCLRRRLESSAAAAASASASASPSWLSVQAQLSELHISGQERTCFALTPSPSRSSQNFRNMPATKLWKVLAFRLGFFPPFSWRRPIWQSKHNNRRTTTNNKREPPTTHWVRSIAFLCYMG